MKRILVIGIILLFIGMSISSSTGFNLEKKSIKPNGFNEVKFECYKKQLLKQNPDEDIKDNLNSTIDEVSPTVDYFGPKNTIPKDYINVQSSNINYYNKWISPLQNESSSFIPRNSPRASSKTINDIPQNTYNGKTLYVGGNGPGNYSLIQMAINAASDGDTVFVYAGTYRQWFWTLWIDKSIRLLGEDSTSTIIIRKGFVQGTPVIDVYADAVTISGFTLIRDLPSWCFLQDTRDCGIRIFGGVRYCVVSRNIFTKSVNGVYLSSYYGAPTFTTVTNNIFRDNSQSGLVMDGVTQSVIENNSFFNCSVRIQESYYNRFTNNTFNGKPLIVLDDTSDVIIQEAGQVVLIGCTNITVVNTTIKGAYIGIWLQHSQYCTITGNYLKNCLSGGIFLEWSNNNNITNNLIDNCYVGLLLGGSHYNRVQRNHIVGNIECPLFMSMAEQNVIDQNIFDNNNDLYTLLQGIYLTGGTNNNYITNNILDNDTIYIQDAWQNQIINNTVNGKPLIHLEGASGNVIDYPTGQIILINCDSIKVRNQTDIVIHVFGSYDCLFENVSLRMNKWVGLFILYSQYINITNCVASEGGYGVQIKDSSHFVIQNNLFWKNIYVALDIGNCTDVSIVHNSFEENGGYTGPSLGPVFIYSSKSIEIRRNNFLGNVKGAYFMDCLRKAIIWDGNYWNQPRTLPKVIPGYRIWLYRFEFDWHPAQEPYDIEV